MKVAILGAGATGCNIGGHLKLGGAEVWLVDIYKAHMEAIARDGLVWTEPDGTVHPPIFFDGAVTDSTRVGSCDVVIILTKCQNTRETVKENPALFGENTTAITFQNGLGSTDILREFFPDERIGYGIMNCGGTVTAPGKTVMLRVPKDNVVFRRMAGGKNNVFAQLEETFLMGGFPCLYTEDADLHVWTKLGVNSMFNMLCGITRICLYDFITHTQGSALLDEIVAETVAVAHAADFMIDPADIYKMRDMALASKSEHYPSGAQDIRNKRSTEVEFLNGAISRKGKELGVPTPVNDTIARLARILETTYERQF